MSVESSSEWQEKEITVKEKQILLNCIHQA